MKKATICFIFEVPFSQRYYERYEINEIVDSGYSVEVIDISRVIHPQMHEKALDTKVKLSKMLKVLRLESRREFVKVVSKQSYDFVWITFQACVETHFFIKHISKYKFGFISRVDYVPPTIDGSRLTVRKQWTLKKIKNGLYSRLPLWMLFLPNADVVITCDEAYLCRNWKSNLLGRKTHVELTNTLDYYSCIRETRFCAETIDLPEDYLVFIDEFLPFHPDGLEQGYSWDANKYYADVEQFLKIVARTNNLDIIIAAHPRADYSKYPQYFKGMRIIYHKTAYLVSNSKLVLSHASLALSYAIIFSKPILLFATSEMLNNYEVLRGIKSVERSLTREVINVSESYDEEMITQMIKNEKTIINSQKVDRLEKYVLPCDHPNRNKSFCEILLKGMKAV